MLQVQSRRKEDGEAGAVGEDMQNQTDGGNPYAGRCWWEQSEKTCTGTGTDWKADKDRKMPYICCPPKRDPRVKNKANADAWTGEDENEQRIWGCEGNWPGCALKCGVIYVHLPGEVPKALCEKP